MRVYDKPVTEKASSRVPPHNLEAEESLLGAMLLSKPSIATAIAVVESEDFYKPAHGQLFEAIRVLYDKGEPVDPLTVANKLQEDNLLDAMGGKNALLRIQAGTPAAANAAHYAGIVARTSRFRTLAGLGGELAEASYGEDDQNVAQAIADIAAMDGSAPVVWPEVVWPEPLARAAYHGLAGEMVKTVAPHTEADPAGVLTQFLVLFGNAVGRSPHDLVGADRHGLSLFLLLVGDTAVGRKGTAYGEAVRPIAQADPTWAKACLGGGLSSGEGLLLRLKEGDKRLVAVETEFAAALKAGNRQGNILSERLRDAWDGRPLDKLTKNDPMRVVDYHLSVIGHATGADLARNLTETDAANGYANRFLWCAVRRAQSLPNGGEVPPDEMNAIVAQVRGALDAARRRERVRRDPDAEGLYVSVYDRLSVSPYPGVLGAVTMRGAPQVIRLSMVYALLGGSGHVRHPDVAAALAVWEYSARSVQWALGATVGNRLADSILAELRQAHPEWMSRSELRGAPGWRANSADLDAALRLIHQLGLIEGRTYRSGGRGRPTQLWRAEGVDRITAFSFGGV